MNLPRYFLGDDVFVSYSRKDGMAYALSLATALTNCRCYVDQLDSTPGQHIPQIVLRRLRRSSVFVLVGTEGAVHSTAVRQELNLFLATMRPIVPISFSKTIETSPLAQLLAGLPFAEEPLEAAICGTPSQTVLSRIDASVNYTRHSNRMRRLLRGTALSAIITAFSVAAYTAAAVYMNNRREECRVAKSDLENHLGLGNQEYASTWPDSWKREATDLEAVVAAKCGEHGRWDESRD